MVELGGVTYAFNPSNCEAGASLSSNPARFTHQVLGLYIETLKTNIKKRRSVCVCMKR